MMMSSDLTLAEKDALRWTNGLIAWWKQTGRMLVTDDAALQLYHFIKDGQTVCPGGECCAGEEV